MQSKTNNKTHNSDTKRKNILIIALIIIIAILLVFGIRGCSTYKEKSITNNGVIWQGNQELTTNKQTPYYNKVIGFDKLHFKANTLNQQVNFYNDKDNKCYMEIYLILPDETVIWESGRLEPNRGFYKITLSQPLKEGVYENCLYRVRMYNIETETEVNSYTNSFTLDVE